MISFSHFELDREDSKFYDFSELDEALSEYEDLYSFRSSKPTVKIFLKDENGEEFFADFCSEKDLPETLVMVCNKYDVAIPERKLLNNSLNILNASKTGDLVCYYPVKKSYGLNSNPELLVTQKAVDELIELGYLIEQGVKKFLVKKTL